MVPLGVMSFHTLSRQLGSVTSLHSSSSTTVQNLILRAAHLPQRKLSRAYSPRATKSTSKDLHSLTHPVRARLLALTRFVLIVVVIFAVNISIELRVIRDVGLR